MALKRSRHAPDTAASTASHPASVTIAIRPSGEWDGTENIRVVRFVTRMMVAEALGGLAEDVTRLLIFREQRIHISSVGLKKNQEVQNFSCQNLLS